MVVCYGTLRWTVSWCLFQHKRKTAKRHARQPTKGETHRLMSLPVEGRTARLRALLTLQDSIMCIWKSFWNNSILLHILQHRNVEKQTCSWYSLFPPYHSPKKTLCVPREKESSIFSVKSLSKLLQKSVGSDVFFLQISMLVVSADTLDVAACRSGRRRI